MRSIYECYQELINEAKLNTNVKNLALVLGVNEKDFLEFRASDDISKEIYNYKYFSYGDNVIHLDHNNRKISVYKASKRQKQGYKDITGDIDFVLTGSRSLGDKFEEKAISTFKKVTSKFPIKGDVVPDVVFEKDNYYIGESVKTKIKHKGFIWLVLDISGDKIKIVQIDDQTKDKINKPVSKKIKVSNYTEYINLNKDSILSSENKISELPKPYDDVPISFTTTNNKTENIQVAEDLLSYLGVVASFAAYSDTNGVSIYFRGVNGDKIRVSNHSTGITRMKDEVQFFFDEKRFNIFTNKYYPPKSKLENNKITANNYNNR